MNVEQLEFENRPLIRALRYESNFEKVHNLINQCQLKELGALCPVTSASALFYAVQRRRDEEALLLAKLLCETKKACSVDHVDRNKQTALFFAGRDGNVQTVEYLLSMGCPMNQRDAASQTALFYAARDGRTAVVKRLLESGVDVNSVDHLGQTALFYACRDGRIETVELMVKMGANPSIRDKQRKTAAAYAIKNGHTDLTTKLKAVKVPGYSAALESGLKTVLSGDSKSNLTPSRAAPIRKRYRLQYALNLKRMDDRKFYVDPEFVNKKINTGELTDSETSKNLLWLYCPLPKIQQFELLFPSIAVWSKSANVPLTKHNIDPMRVQWYIQALEILSELTSYEGGWIFAKPVDCRSWNCPDYYRVVKRPMDFSTIRKNLRNGEYSRCGEFLADLNQVFSNCYVYNRPESSICKIGTNLEMYFKNLVILKKLDDWDEKQATVEAYINELSEHLRQNGIGDKTENPAVSSNDQKLTIDGLQLSNADALAEECRDISGNVSSV